MASGVAVNDSVTHAFQALKSQHKLHYLILKLSDNMKEIVVDQQCSKEDNPGTGEENYESFMGHMSAAEKLGECRYAVYDVNYMSDTNVGKEKVVFIAWSPDSSKVKQKMVYASSQGQIKKVLGSGLAAVQASDHDDLKWEHIVECCKKHARD